MGYNILYIEDNPDNMMLVKRALEARGYKLLQAMRGEEGVTVAETEEVDLILLDINLPDIDGYEVARRIRGSQKKHTLSYLPIIAVTANALKATLKKPSPPAVMCICPSRSISASYGRASRHLCHPRNRKSNRLKNANAITCPGTLSHLSRPRILPICNAQGVEKHIPHTKFIPSVPTANRRSSLTMT